MDGAAANYPPPTRGRGGHGTRSSGTLCIPARDVNARKKGLKESNVIVVAAAAANNDSPAISTVDVATTTRGSTKPTNGYGPTSLTGDPPPYETKPGSARTDGRHRGVMG